MIVDLIRARATFGTEIRTLHQQINILRLKYITARSVVYVYATEPDVLEKLTRLASIGLLTEVVEDFIKPVEPATKVNLTIAVDALLSLDYLSCLGFVRRDDVRGIFDALRGIGCSFVVFPTTCEEMQRNQSLTFAVVLVAGLRDVVGIDKTLPMRE